MTVKDAQVRRLMEEMAKHGEIGRAAMRADMDRKTARKYVQCGRLPSELKAPRTYRTRPDPFEADWPWVEQQLGEAPGLEAYPFGQPRQCASHPGRVTQAHGESEPRWRGGLA